VSLGYNTETKFQSPSPTSDTAGEGIGIDIVKVQFSIFYVLFDR